MSPNKIWFDVFPVCQKIDCEILLLKLMNKVFWGLNTCDWSVPSVGVVTLTFNWLNQIESKNDSEEMSLWNN